MKIQPREIRKMDMRSPNFLPLWLVTIAVFGGTNYMDHKLEAVKDMGGGGEGKKSLIGWKIVWESRRPARQAEQRCVVCPHNKQKVTKFFVKHFWNEDVTRKHIVLYDVSRPRVNTLP